MNMNENQNTGSHSPAIVEKWAEAMAQVLGKMAGTPLSSAVLAEPLADLPGGGENDLWVLGTCSGALRGEMCLRVPAAAAVHLGQLFRGEPDVPGAQPSTDDRDAVLELLHQANTLFAASLKQTYGEVQIRLEPATAAPSWSAASTAWLRFREDVPVFVEVQLSAALVAALRTETTEVASSEAGAADAAPGSAGSHDEKVNLQALLDVELGVSLRFGSRRLLLRDILDLSPGSVIELDRQVQEPVDMLLDGRVVARGDIVVIEGNYGLRVTEVAPSVRS